MKCNNLTQLLYQENKNRNIEREKKIKEENKEGERTREEDRKK